MTNMNLNQITEKAVAEQLGALMLENAKLKAVAAAANAQIVSLKSRVAELEGPKANGGSNGSADEVMEAH
jgi:hypothetical protein